MLASVTSLDRHLGLLPCDIGSPGFATAATVPKFFQNKELHRTHSPQPVVELVAACDAVVSAGYLGPTQLFSPAFQAFPPSPLSPAHAFAFSPGTSIPSAHVGRVIAPVLLV